MHDRLLVLKTTCWFFSDSGINSSGKIIPTCSKVAVFSPKRLPLLSFWTVRKVFAHHNWAIKHTEPDSFKPITPQPVFPVHVLFLGQPAASEVKVLAQRGGYFGGLQIGIQRLGSSRKPHQTVISDTALAVRVISLFGSFSNIFKHLRMLNGKQRKNGHI